MAAIFEYFQQYVESKGAYGIVSELSDGQIQVTAPATSQEPTAAAAYIAALATDPAASSAMAAIATNTQIIAAVAEYHSEKSGYGWPYDGWRTEIGPVINRVLASEPTGMRNFVTSAEGRIEGFERQAAIAAATSGMMTSTTTTSSTTATMSSSGNSSAIAGTATSGGGGGLSEGAKIGIGVGVGVGVPVLIAILVLIFVYCCRRGAGAFRRGAEAGTPMSQAGGPIAGGPYAGEATSAAGAAGIGGLSGAAASGAGSASRAGAGTASAGIGAAGGAAGTAAGNSVGGSSAWVNRSLAGNTTSGGLDLASAGVAGGLAGHGASKLANGAGSGYAQTGAASGSGVQSGSSAGATGEGLDGAYGQNAASGANGTASGISSATNGQHNLVGAAGGSTAQGSEGLGAGLVGAGAAGAAGAAGYGLSKTANGAGYGQEATSGTTQTGAGTTSSTTGQHNLTGNTSSRGLDAGTAAGGAAGYGASKAASRNGFGQNVADSTNGSTYGYGASGNSGTTSSTGQTSSDSSTLRAADGTPLGELFAGGAGAGAAGAALGHATGEKSKTGSGSKATGAQSSSLTQNRASTRSSTGHKFGTGAGLAGVTGALGTAGITGIAGDKSLSIVSHVVIVSLDQELDNEFLQSIFSAQEYSWYSNGWYKIVTVSTRRIIIIYNRQLESREVTLSEGEDVSSTVMQSQLSAQEYSWFSRDWYRIVTIDGHRIVVVFNRQLDLQLTRICRVLVTDHEQDLNASYFQSTLSRQEYEWYLSGWYTIVTYTDTRLVIFYNSRVQTREITLSAGQESNHEYLHSKLLLQEYAWYLLGWFKLVTIGTSKNMVLINRLVDTASGLHVRDPTAGHASRSLGTSSSQSIGGANTARTATRSNVDRQITGQTHNTQSGPSNTTTSRTIGASSLSQYGTAAGIGAGIGAAEFSGSARSGITGSTTDHTADGNQTTQRDLTGSNVDQARGTSLDTASDVSSGANEQNKKVLGVSDAGETTNGNVKDTTTGQTTSRDTITSQTIGSPNNLSRNVNSGSTTQKIIPGSSTTNTDLTPDSQAAPVSGTTSNVPTGKSPSATTSSATAGSADKSSSSKFGLAGLATGLGLGGLLSGKRNSKSLEPTETESSKNAKQTSATTDSSKVTGPAAKQSISATTDKSVSNAGTAESSTIPGTTGIMSTWEETPTGSGWARREQIAQGSQPEQYELSAVPGSVNNQNIQGTAATEQDSRRVAPGNVSSLQSSNIPAGDVSNVTGSEPGKPTTSNVTVGGVPTQRTIGETRQINDTTSQQIPGQNHTRTTDGEDVAGTTLPTTSTVSSGKTEPSTIRSVDDSSNSGQAFLGSVSPSTRQFVQGNLGPGSQQDVTVTQPHIVAGTSSAQQVIPATVGQIDSTRNVEPQTAVRSLASQQSTPIASDQVNTSKIPTRAQPNIQGPQKAAPTGAASSTVTDTTPTSSVSRVQDRIPTDAIAPTGTATSTTRNVSNNERQSTPKNDSDLTEAERIALASSVPAALLGAGAVAGTKIAQGRAPERAEFTKDSSTVPTVPVTSKREATSVPAAFTRDDTTGSVSTTPFTTTRDVATGEGQKASGPASSSRIPRAPGSSTVVSKFTENAKDISETEPSMAPAPTTSDAKKRSSGVFSSALSRFGIGSKSGKSDAKSSTPKDAPATGKGGKELLSTSKLTDGATTDAVSEKPASISVTRDQTSDSGKPETDITSGLANVTSVKRSIEPSGADTVNVVGREVPLSRASEGKISQPASSSPATGTTTGGIIPTTTSIDRDVAPGATQVNRSVIPESGFGKPAEVTRDQSTIPSDSINTDKVDPEQLKSTTTRELEQAQQGSNISTTLPRTSGYSTDKFTPSGTLGSTTQRDIVNQPKGLSSHPVQQTGSYTTVVPGTLQSSVQPSISGISDAAIPRSNPLAADGTLLPSTTRGSSGISTTKENVPTGSSSEPYSPSGTETTGTMPVPVSRTTRTDAIVPGHEDGARDYYQTRTSPGAPTATNPPSNVSRSLVAPIEPSSSANVVPSVSTEKMPSNTVQGQQKAANIGSINVPSTRDVTALGPATQTSLPSQGTATGLTRSSIPDKATSSTSRDLQQDAASNFYGKVSGNDGITTIGSVQTPASRDLSSTMSTYRTEPTTQASIADTTRSLNTGTSSTWTQRDPQTDAAFGFYGKHPGITATGISATAPTSTTERSILSTGSSQLPTSATIPDLATSNNTAGGNAIQTDRNLGSSSAVVDNATLPGAFTGTSESTLPATPGQVLDKSIPGETATRKTTSTAPIDATNRASLAQSVGSLDTAPWSPHSTTFSVPGDRSSASSDETPDESTSGSPLKLSTVIAGAASSAAGVLGMTGIAAALAPETQNDDKHASATSPREADEVTRSKTPIREHEIAEQAPTEKTTTAGTTISGTDKTTTERPKTLEQGKTTTADSLGIAPEIIQAIPVTSASSTTESTGSRKAIGPQVTQGSSTSTTREIPSQTTTVASTLVPESSVSNVTSGKSILEQSSEPTSSVVKDQSVTIPKGSSSIDTTTTPTNDPISRDGPVARQSTSVKETTATHGSAPEVSVSSSVPVAPTTQSERAVSSAVDTTPSANETSSTRPETAASAVTSSVLKQQNLPGSVSSSTPASSTTDAKTLPTTVASSTTNNNRVAPTTEVLLPSQTLASTTTPLVTPSENVKSAVAGTTASTEDSPKSARSTTLGSNGETATVQKPSSLDSPEATKSATTAQVLPASNELPSLVSAKEPTVADGQVGKVVESNISATRAPEPATSDSSTYATRDLPSGASSTTAPTSRTAVGSTAQGLEPVEPVTSDSTTYATRELPSGTSSNIIPATRTATVSTAESADFVAPTGSEKVSSTTTSGSTGKVTSGTTSTRAPSEKTTGSIGQATGVVTPLDSSKDTSTPATHSTRSATTGTLGTATEKTSDTTNNVQDTVKQASTQATTALAASAAAAASAVGYLGSQLVSSSDSKETTPSDRETKTPTDQTTAPSSQSSNATTGIYERAQDVIGKASQQISNTASDASTATKSALNFGGQTESTAPETRNTTAASSERNITTGSNEPVPSSATSNTSNGVYETVRDTAGKTAEQVSNTAARATTAASSAIQSASQTLPTTSQARETLAPSTKRSTTDEIDRTTTSQTESTGPTIYEQAQNVAGQAAQQISGTISQGTEATYFTAKSIGQNLPAPSQLTEILAPSTEQTTTREFGNEASQKDSTGTTLYEQAQAAARQAGQQISSTFSQTADTISSTASSAGKTISDNTLSLTQAQESRISSTTRDTTAGTQAITGQKSAEKLQDTLDKVSEQASNTLTGYTTDSGRSTGQTFTGKAQSTLDKVSEQAPSTLADYAHSSGLSTTQNSSENTQSTIDKVSEQGTNALSGIAAAASSAVESGKQYLPSTETVQSVTSTGTRGVTSETDKASHVQNGTTNSGIYGAIQGAIGQVSNTLTNSTTTTGSVPKPSEQVSTSSSSTARQQASDSFVTDPIGTSTKFAPKATIVERTDTGSASTGSVGRKFSITHLESHGETVDAGDLKELTFDSPEAAQQHIQQIVDTHVQNASTSTGPQTLGVEHYQSSGSSTSGMTLWGMIKTGLGYNTATTESAMDSQRALAPKAVQEKVASDGSTIVKMEHYEPTAPGQTGMTTWKTTDTSTANTTTATSAQDLEARPILANATEENFVVSGSKDSTSIVSAGTASGQHQGFSLTGKETVATGIEQQTETGSKAASANQPVIFRNGKIIIPGQSSETNESTSSSTEIISSQEKGSTVLTSGKESNAGQNEYQLASRELILPEGQEISSQFMQTVLSPKEYTWYLSGWYKIITSGGQKRIVFHDRETQISSNTQDVGADSIQQLASRTSAFSLGSERNVTGTTESRSATTPAGQPNIDFEQLRQTLPTEEFEKVKMNTIISASDTRTIATTATGNTTTGRTATDITTTNAAKTATDNTTAKTQDSSNFEQLRQTLPAGDFEKVKRDTIVSAAGTHGNSAWQTTNMASFLFKWPYPATHVEVRGTFGDWYHDQKLEKKDGVFQKLIEFPATTNKILYKFIVDDQWATDAKLPTENDPAGNINNVLLPEQFTWSTQQSSNASTGTTQQSSGSSSRTTQQSSDSASDRRILNLTGPNGEVQELNVTGKSQDAIDALVASHTQRFSKTVETTASSSSSNRRILNLATPDGQTHELDVTDKSQDEIDALIASYSKRFTQTIETKTLSSNRSILNLTGTDGKTHELDVTGKSQEEIDQLIASYTRNSSKTIETSSSSGRSILNLTTPDGQVHELDITSKSQQEIDALVESYTQRYSKSTPSSSGRNILNLTTPDGKVHELDVTGKSQSEVDALVESYRQRFNKQTLNLTTPDGQVHELDVTNKSQSEIDALVESYTQRFNKHTLNLTTPDGKVHELDVTDKSQSEIDALVASYSERFNKSILNLTTPDGQTHELDVTGKSESEVEKLVAEYTQRFSGNRKVTTTSDSEQSRELSSRRFMTITTSSGEKHELDVTGKSEAEIKRMVAEYQEVSTTTTTTTTTTGTGGASMSFEQMMQELREDEDEDKEYVSAESREFYETSEGREEGESNVTRTYVSDVDDKPGMPSLFG